MEIEDLEFNINEFEEDEAFFKITDDLEGQVIREVEPLTQKHKYYCYLWNNSCSRSICLGFELDEHQVNDIIITLTH
jgi:hypothetical protein